MPPLRLRSIGNKKAVPARPGPAKNQTEEQRAAAAAAADRQMAALLSQVLPGRLP